VHAHLRFSPAVTLWSAGSGKMVGSYCLWKAAACAVQLQVAIRGSARAIDVSLLVLAQGMAGRLYRLLLYTSAGHR
jgi:hypothetical protein